MAANDGAEKGSHFLAETVAGSKFVFKTHESGKERVLKYAVLLGKICQEVGTHFQENKECG